MDELLPEGDFRLFAMSVRFPHNLAQQVELRLVQAGVYEVRHFTGSLRVVVHQLPQEEHNALLHLFSARADLLRYGTERYRMRSPETSTLLFLLFQRYLREGPLMPDQLEEFARQTIEEILRTLPAAELRKHLSLEQRLEGLSQEELRKRLSPEQRLEGLSPDELLAALSPEAREALARGLKDNGSSSHPG